MKISLLHGGIIRLASLGVKHKLSKKQEYQPHFFVDVTEMTLENRAPSPMLLFSAQFTCRESDFLTKLLAQAHNGNH